VASTTTPAWGFRAFLTKPHDGDSFWMMCDTGFGQRAEPELRLSGVHAPEIHPLQPGGLETLDYVNGWLAAANSTTPARRWPFWVEVQMTTTFEPQMNESFTRYVAVVYPFDRRNYADSLNAAVNAFVVAHPDWPTGD
jgi:endonuclease YncB( thermonuclease family)